MAQKVLTLQCDVRPEFITVLRSEVHSLENSLKLFEIRNNKVRRSEVMAKKLRTSKSLYMAGILGLIAYTSVSTSYAMPIFDNFDIQVVERFSSRGPESSPGALVQIGTNDIDISQIAVRNDLSSSGSLTFLIFDHPTENLLFSSAPKFFVDDGVSYKTSDPFLFTLAAGGFYDIGAISNVGANWSFDQIGNSQNGITSIRNNPNFRNFLSPTSGSHAAADGHIQLFAGTSQQVYEPSALALLAIGTIGFGVARRNQRYRRL